MKPDSYDVGWAAGIMDGEGSIMITRWLNKELRHTQSTPVYRLHVRVCNTDIRMLECLQELFGGRIAPWKTRNVRAKPAAEWVLTNRKAADFLEIVYPYLRVKHEQAKLAILFIRKKVIGRGGQGHVVSAEQVAWRDDIRQKLVALNHRGIA